MSSPCLNPSLVSRMSHRMGSIDSFRCYLAELLFRVILWLLPKDSAERYRFAKFAYDYGRWSMNKIPEEPA